MEGGGGGYGGAGDTGRALRGGGRVVGERDEVWQWRRGEAVGAGKGGGEGVQARRFGHFRFGCGGGEAGREEAWWAGRLVRRGEEGEERGLSRWKKGSVGQDFAGSVSLLIL